ncbi:MAG: peptidylprolyl isomerase [Pseudomonadales bacterium]
MFLRRLLLCLLCCGTVAQADSPRVLINTTMGDIIVALDDARAPVTTANFLSYVDDEAYDGTIFHRVIPGFMIQGGGHLPDMKEVESKDEIINEADNGLKNVTGTLAMARTNIIDSASMQFFINVSDNEFLDHSDQSCTRAQEQAMIEARQRGLNKPVTCKTFGYAVFGKVIEGMDVVHDIEIVQTHISMGFPDVPTEPVVINRIRRLDND